MQLRHVALLSVFLFLPCRGARAQEFQQKRPDQPAVPAPVPKLTRPPKVKVPAQPVYPPEALAQGLGADVKLQLDLDVDGKVTNVDVVEAAGNGFDEAAREAALKMEFEPAEVDGKPSPIRIEYVQRFRPAVPAPPPPPEVAPPPPPVPPADKVVLVRGRVRERGTRDPIAGADVSLARQDGPAPADPAATTLVATTDEDGRFVAMGQPGGRARLVISSGLHEPCIRDLDLPGPGVPPIELTCTVARLGGAAYETVVQAAREGEEVTRHTVSQPEMTTVPGTFGDPLRVIQNLPGVARAPYGLGLLIIRGSSPQDTGVYVDGVKVPLLYHFLGGPSVLTPELLDRIEFYPGGFGVRYGRATAGVVDVVTRTQPLRQVHGFGQVTVLDSSAGLQGPLGRGYSAEIAARRSYIDALLPAVIPQDEAVVAPVYWDYQTRVSRSLPGGRLSLFVFGSDDSLKAIIPDSDAGDVDIGTRIGFHRVIGTYASAPGGWTSVLTPSYGYDLFAATAAQVGIDAFAHVLALREDLSRAVAPWLKLAMGLDAEMRFEHFAVDVPLPPDRRTYGQAERTATKLGRDQRNQGIGAYLEALWDPHPKVRAVPGLRLDWFRIAGEDRLSVDPRIVVRWARSPSQAFKVGAGIFHQAPNNAEMDRDFGNPALPLLWSDQYHAGWEQGLTRALSLDLTGYYLRRHALPIGSSEFTSDGRLERYVGEGRGRGYGLELRLRHAVTEKFYGWISYTLARSEVVLSRRNPLWRPTDFDQTHNLIVVASRRLGSWELGTRFRLVSGVPETPIEGGEYDADFNRYQARQGPTNSTRRQLFHQLDVRIQYTFIFDVWKLMMFVDVQNVYNAQNPEATLYDYRFRDSAPLRGLPILPVLGFRGDF